MAEDKDWRLQLDLEQPANLERLLEDVRDDPFEQDARASLGDDVVLTHDGGRFFAYAMTDDALMRAREAIESVLRHDGRTGTLRLSHWDGSIWQQTDPPLSSVEAQQQEQEAEAQRREAQGPSVTRTVACVTGKLIRKSFEQQMLNLANDLGLACEMVEHPHLLSTQVAFNLTGPASDIEEFARYLRSEARATVVVDLGSIPFGLP
jgi:hypothetical protein